MGVVWSFFSSVVSSALNFIFRLSIVKFVVFGALSLVLTPLMAIIMGLVEATGIGDLQALFDLLPEGVLYFLVVFRFDIGLPMIIGAMLTRFFIRRLPVVG